MDKKKTLILSILGVIVLVVAVVGISYAMYTFTGTGSKENVISTGTISVSYDETDHITLTNTYSATDAYATNADNNAETLAFSVNADIAGGNTTIKYDVQLLVTEDSAATGLKDEHIDFNMSKTTNGTTTWLHGTTETTGVALSTVAGTNGTVITTGGYVVANNTFTKTEESTVIYPDAYVIKAWVNDTYSLPSTDVALGLCTGGTLDGQIVTETECTTAESAGTWVEQPLADRTIPSTFSFKVKVVAEG